MSRQRILRMRLDEVSTVDLPAQTGAVAVILKRGESPALRLAKATFQEALEGQLVASRVNEAFYQSFNGLWERNDAFRTALTDELAEGGDGSTASAAYVASVKALVDEAVNNARAAGAEASDEELGKAFSKAATDWLAGQERDMTIKTKADLTAAIEKAQAEGDKVTVATVAAIHKAAGELKAEDLLPASGPLAKAAPAIDPALAQRVERMEKRDALSTETRKHYDGLTSDTDRDAFLALDAAGQAAEISKAGGDDPVVYTTLDGIDIRKSAGDTMLAMAKGRDEDRRKLAKAEAASEDAVLSKRAGDELGNIGGELVGKKALLKAVDGITDAPTKDVALAVLKAANAAGKGSFVRKGATAESVGPVDNGNGPEMTEAEMKLDELAKAEAKASNISFEQAYTKVIQTTEGAALYKRYVDDEE